VINFSCLILVIFVFLVLGSLLPLIAFICPKKSTFRIFLIIPLSHRTVETSKSLIFIFAPLIVNLPLNPHGITILLEVLSIWLWLVLASHMLCTFLVSLYSLPLTSTIVIFFVSCVTLVGPLLAVCSSRALALFNSKATLMLLGPETPNHRPLSAYCVFLGGSLIAWKTKKQTVVSHLTTEAELWAMALLRQKWCLATMVTWGFRRFSFCANSSLVW
jgi:hypothetical protein